MMVASMNAFYSLSIFSVFCLGFLFTISSLANPEDFNKTFYLTKVCTSYITEDNNEYCEDGYLLKSETSEGEVKETVLMDGIGGYGWKHISFGKIDDNTLHVYVGCGSPCGSNILFGRDDKEQYFDLYFSYNANSQCSVEYDPNKKLWIARLFFSDKEIVLPSTYGPSNSAVYPKYDVEFDKKGRLIVKGYFEEETVQTLPNPCTST